MASLRSPFWRRAAIKSVAEWRRNITLKGRVGDPELTTDHNNSSAVSATTRIQAPS
jgi:hypothetical protein